MEVDEDEQSESDSPSVVTSTENLSDEKTSPKQKEKKSPLGTITTPSDYRPGRLSHLEILHRLFPYQRQEVLELVLQGCSGDIVKAIEHFICANEALSLTQSGGKCLSSPNSGETMGQLSPFGSHSYPDATSKAEPLSPPQPKVPKISEQKSAFAPLTGGHITSTPVVQTSSEGNIFGSASALATPFVRPGPNSFSMASLIRSSTNPICSLAPNFALSTGQFTYPQFGLTLNPWAFGSIANFPGAQELRFHTAEETLNLPITHRGKVESGGDKSPTSPASSIDSKENS